MADKNNKFSQNIDGQFYVDDQCIACDACVMEATNYFEMNDDEGHAFVKKQPTTEEALSECMTALELCPVDAIGKDG
mgnify:CR=1 FL=1